ncbi:MAG: hypothetical protein H0V82_01355 [Candidatus Protochlamydia sp.]|nr:hypothetical protein [Candidatus Protochlamydia sp.]
MQSITFSLNSFINNSISNFEFSNLSVFNKKVSFLFESIICSKNITPISSFKSGEFRPDNGRARMEREIPLISKQKSQPYIINSAPPLKADSTETIQSIVKRDDLQEVRLDLAKKLNDIERVDKIIYDYAVLKDKIPEPENQKLFEKWMGGIAYFLGSPYYDHQLFFRHQDQNSYFSHDPEFKAAYNTFVNSIQQHSTPLHKTFNTAEKVKNIAIMYPGTGGGGHKAPATAMAKSLEKQGYKVKLLDSDEFERPYDPKIGGLCRGEIFSKIYQQAGDMEKACQMWEEGNCEQKIEDRRYMKDLTEALKEFDADHLFVVAHHQPEHTSLAYQLGLPTTYVHTDNEFHNNLQEVSLNQQELARPLVSFTSLSDNSEFYHYLLNHEGKGHYNELPPEVKKQMVRLNFPVRESFQPVTKAEKGEIRQKLGIAEDATVVKIAMGANGIPKDIKEMIGRLKNEEHTVHKPLHVLIACGANESLKKELEYLNAQTVPPSPVSFQILGFLDEKEMAEFDKASDVWVTKPGGSTSAEAKQMRKQVLYVPNHHHLWELTNARALEKDNLAEELKAEESMISQINRRAEIGEHVEYLASQNEPWAGQLASIVHQTALPIMGMMA